MDPLLQCEISDSIAEISLARPPVNALDLRLLERLIETLRQAAADRNIRAVVLTSALPGRFCAGLDLRELLDQSETQVRRYLEKLYVELGDAQYNLGKPSIAAVNGAARGGGMTLAISCDVLIAGESATFGYPEIDLGLAPRDPFCAPAGHRRPASGLRAVVQRAQLRRGGSEIPGTGKQGGAGRQGAKRGAGTRPRLCREASYGNATRTRGLHARERLSTQDRRCRGCVLQCGYERRCPGRAACVPGEATTARVRIIYPSCVLLCAR